VIDRSILGGGSNQTFQCDDEQRVLLRPDDPNCLCFECTCARLWGHKCLRRFVSGEITKEYYFNKEGGYNPLHVTQEEKPDGSMCICEECACEKCHEDGDKSKTFCYHPKTREMVVH